jgi:hypothetical protein
MSGPRLSAAFDDAAFALPPGAGAEAWAAAFGSTVRPHLHDVPVDTEPPSMRTVRARKLMLQFVAAFLAVADEAQGLMSPGDTDEVDEEADALLLPWRTHVTPLVRGLWFTFAKVYVARTPDGSTTLPLDDIHALWAGMLAARLIDEPHHGRWTAAPEIPKAMHPAGTPLGRMTLGQLRQAIERIRRRWTRLVYDEGLRAITEALFTHAAFLSRWAFPEAEGVLDDESMRVVLPGAQEPGQRRFGVGPAFLSLCTYVFHDWERLWTWRRDLVATIAARGLALRAADDLAAQTAPFPEAPRRWLEQGTRGGRLPLVRDHAMRFTWAAVPGDLGLFRENFRLHLANAANIMARLRPEENRTLVDMIKGSDDEPLGILDVPRKDPAARFVQEVRDGAALYLMGQQVFLFANERFAPACTAFDFLDARMDQTRPWRAAGATPLFIRCGGEVFVLTRDAAMHTSNVATALHAWLAAAEAAAPVDETKRRLAALRANMFERGVYVQAPHERNGVLVDGDEEEAVAPGQAATAEASQAGGAEIVDAPF